MLYRITTAAALATMLAAPLAAQRRDSTLTRAERRHVESQLDSLRQQMRVLQERLGQNGFSVFSGDGGPMVWALSLDNRARLGVIVRTEPGDGDDQGARLQGVTPNGPADDAGLRAGDVITKVNGVSLAGARPTPGDRLIELVNDLDDGDTVHVEYRRDGRTATTNVIARDGNSFDHSYRLPALAMELDSLPATMDRSRIVLDRALAEARGMPGIRASFFTSRWSNMELTTLDHDLGAYFGTTEGVLVVRAPSDSLLGLKSGDVILRIGGRAPTSPSHAIRILQSYNAGDEIRLDVMRDHRRQTLNATVPDDADRGLYWDWKR